MRSSPPSPRILVAGVGNLLLRDDGVGIHAVKELQKQALPDVDMVDLGTAILHAQPFLEQAERVLVLDAAQGGGPPGTLYEIRPAEQRQHAAAASIHSIGLVESMRFLAPARRPPEILVLGVEPERMECGMTLTEPVANAMYALLARANVILRRWRNTRLVESAATSIGVEV